MSLRALQITCSAVLLAIVVAIAPVAAQPNPHFTLERSIALPGRGMAIAWSPDGTRLASTAGGIRVHLEGNFDVAGPDTSAIIWRRD